MGRFYLYIGGNSNHSGGFCSLCRLVAVILFQFIARFLTARSGLDFLLVDCLQEYLRKRV